jgi:hypothetical protein
MITEATFHENPPCLFSHPRNLDWTARVLVLQSEMTNSDAQGVADIEYRSGKLPAFSPNSPEIAAAKEYIAALKG